MKFLHVKRSSSKKNGNAITPLSLPSVRASFCAALAFESDQLTLSYLNVRDLLACRQVNKVWMEEATKKLQGMVLVRIQDWHSLEQFNRVITAHVKTFPPNMFTAVELGEHVRLQDKTFQVSVARLAPLVKRLVVSAKAGPTEWRWLLFNQFSHISELHIHGIALFQPIITALVPKLAEDFRLSSSATPGSSLIAAASPPLSPQKNSPIKGQFRPKDLPNLRKLSFDMRNRKSVNIFVRRFLRDIFSVAPNLQSLEWIKEDPFGNDFQKMFDCLMMKIKPGESKIEVLKCPSLVCGATELKDIVRQRFPLKEVHIQISSDVPAQCLAQFLEALGDTLQVLKLEFCPGIPLNLTVHSPDFSLIHLREISLTEYRMSIGFVGHLPALKKLTLTRTNIRRALISIEWSFGNQEQTELSKSLEVLFVFDDYLSREQENCTREIVLKLAHCFPNLKAIRLEGLNDNSIRHLFKSFNCLEELYAPGGTYSDEAFRSYTGKEQSSMSCSEMCPNRYSLSAFDASHLAKLRTLELESIGLGDEFITQEISSWRSLRNLNIKYCRISYGSLCRILMDLDLQQLSLHFCTIITDGIMGVHSENVEMLHEDDALVMTYDKIQKWRLGAFMLLFEHNL